MTKRNILVVSHPDTMKQELLDWVSSEERFDMRFAETHEQAIELSAQQLFDLVLIDKTDELVNVKKLAAILPRLNSEILLLGYEGEPVEKIKEKVNLAFDYRKFKRMQRLLILDSSEKQKDDGIVPFSLN
jgi:DNA-binding response OmpR family regulator